MKNLGIFKNIRSKATAAFSVIEIALALAVIAIGLISIIGATSVLIGYHRQSIENNEIAFALQQAVANDYATLFTPDTLDALSTPSTNYISPNNNFKATKTIAYVLGTNVLATNAFVTYNSKSLLKTVRITYSWPTNATKPQTRSFFTEVAATRDIEMTP